MPNPFGHIGRLIGLILRFRAGGRFEIVRWILGWGDAAEVLAPTDLRDHVAGILASAAANYGSPVQAASIRSQYRP